MTAEIRTLWILLLLLLVLVLAIFAWEVSVHTPRPYATQEAIDLLFGPAPPSFTTRLVPAMAFLQE